MSHPFQGDLLHWSAEQFRLAGELCRGCRAYHASFGYRRLSRLIGGVEADVDPLAALLVPLLSAAPRQVLIAGSADTGLTALLRELAGSGGPDHALVVVDRCETPLAACRAYARTHGLRLQTLRCDLRELVLDEAADLIVGHSILAFQDAAGRAELLRRLARALRRDGRLVLSTRLAAPGQSRVARPTGAVTTTTKPTIAASARPAAASTAAPTTTASPAPQPVAERWAGHYSHDVTQALIAAGTPLPCSAVEFDRLLHDCATVEQHSSPYAQRDELQAELEAAGFRVERWLPGGRGLAFLDDGSVRPGARPTWVAQATVQHDR